MDDGDIGPKRDDLTKGIDKKKIQFVAYLFMFFLGASWASIGVVVNSISVNLGVGVPSIVASFTSFTIACTIMVFVTTGVLLEFYSIKKVSLSAIFLLLGGIGIILIATNMLTLNIALFTYGIGYGMSFSLGYYYIIYITDNKSRAAKMAIVSLIYSVGAMAAPKISSLMLSVGISWHLAFSCYIVVMIVSLIMIIYTRFALPGEENPRSKSSHPKLKAARTWVDELSSWPITVYIMGFALFIYVIAETIIVLWLVVYGNKELGMTLEMASYLASIFWGSVIIGRFIAGYALKVISPELYICIICIVSGILLVLFSSISTNPTTAFILIALCGIGFAAAYSTIASSGTTQVPHATGRLTSVMLGAGALGTVAAPLITSYVVSISGLEYVFVYCAFFMFFVVVLVLIVMAVNRMRGYKQHK